MLDLEHSDCVIPNNQDVPTNNLDIFYKSVAQFLPEGKTMNDLTEEEKAEVMNKYRFSPLKPSQYQTVSGMGYHGRGGML